jgi:prepilin signal peptidase PulO-like enzyme (type II secretory pathway)
MSLLGRSLCPSCRHGLFWKDLIPVFSFLFLKGHCRYCKKRISVQYPLVELATGIIFFLIFNNFINLEHTLYLARANFVVYLNLSFLFYIASSLIVIFVYDLRYYLIPDKVLLPTIAIIFIFRFLEFLNFSHWDLIRNLKLEIWNSAAISNFILAAIIASGFFLIIFLISGGRWMGFGDVKLAVLLGLLLGLPNILVALFLAFFSGALMGTILMVLKKKNLKSEIAFGPFLIAGTFIALLWGSEIINWYLKIFNF